MRSFIFDLDGTLAESKERISDVTADKLRRLLEQGVVGIISGAHWAQFETQVVGPVGPHERLTLAPVSGGQVRCWIDGSWQTVSETGLRIDFDAVVAAFQAAFTRLGYTEEPGWGPKFEDREFQVTWSALGQAAPGTAKRAWDPDFSRRERMIAVLRELLPAHLSLRAGGATSIDVAMFEKDLGIREILAHWADRGTSWEKAVYVGDALFPGGNDWPATKTPIRCLRTTGVAETERLIEGFIAGD